jgi:fatty acid desaturase
MYDTKAVPSKQPRPRGYRLSSEAKAVLRGHQATSLLRSIATALSDHGTLLLIIGTATLLQLFAAPGVWLLLTPPLWLLAARFQRGLEVLVHEGSHYNFHRSSLGRTDETNDRATNFLAAYPVFSDVKTFREAHLPHHNLFGTEHDPCFHRFTRFDWQHLARTTPLLFIRQMASQMRPYMWGWWSLVGTNWKVFLRGCLWHLLILVLPLCAFLGIRGLLLWVWYWLIPFVVVLPWLRFVAEAGKHRYEDTHNVFDATISNIGPVHRWYFHPHGDGYHLLHHLDPTIPHHQLRKVHQLLLGVDPEYATRHHHRRSVFEEVRAGEKTLLAGADLFAFRPAPEPSVADESPEEASRLVVTNHPGGEV